MKKLALGLTTLALFWCSHSNAGSFDSEYYQCVKKGIQYYKDIGSYPRLHSENISAEDKAKRMCKNSLVAFGE